MDTIYTKEQCLDWIKNPQVDPVTHQSILNDKKQFKILLDKCKILLSIDDIQQHNSDMLSIIYPDTLEIDAPISPTYHVTRLGDEQHQYFTQAVYDKNISKEDILERINDDKFISGILFNERSLLTEKHDRYTSLIDNFGDKPQFNKHITMIANRLSSLGDQESFQKELIEAKRTQLLKLVESLHEILGESRSFIHQIIYQKIIYFSSAHDLSMINLLIGKMGTGKTAITQLFANLYFCLGMLNTNIVRKLVSPLNIECMIYSDRNLSTDLFSFRHLCAFNLVKQDVKSSQKFLQENGNIRHLFDDIIYLTDYNSSELSAILFNTIKHLYLNANQLEPHTHYIDLLITKNSNLFTNQANNIHLLAHYLINDHILISSQKQAYGQENVDNTLKKFFLHKR